MTPRHNTIQTIRENLARLLATENLTVQHSAAAITASFDVTKRILTLPVWNHATPEVYDMLVAHEVGHAKHTPNDSIFMPICKRVCPEDPLAFFGYMNLIEDIRIDRMMKEEFAGLRRSYNIASKTLFDVDFFGIKEYKGDYSTLSLGDRINLAAKLAPYGHIEVHFSPEEQILVDEAFSAKTFDEVVAVAEKLFVYDPSSTLNKSLVKYETDIGDGIENSTKKGTDISCPSPAGSGNKHRPLKTVMAASKSVEKMGTKTKYRSDYDYLKMPRMEMQKIVTDYKTVRNELFFLTNEGNFSGNHFFQAIKERNNSYIMNLVKQFEQKMAADILLRTRTAKSGRLNMKRIAEYKFSDDLFCRNKIITKGKNHGMVFFLDWSGSMSDTLMATTEQLLILCLFCRRMNIPYDVYAFTTRHLEKDDSISPDYSIDPSATPECNTKDYLNLQGIGLIHFLSSRMTAKEFQDGAGILLHLVYLLGGSHNDLVKKVAPKLTGHWVQNHNQTNDAILNKYILRNTPLCECLYIAINLVNMFQSQNRVDIVNTIVLTDGAPTSTVARSYEGNTIVHMPNRQQILIRGQGMDEETGMVNLLKAMTGSNVIQLHLCSQKTAMRMIPTFMTDPASTTNALKMFRNEKFFSYIPKRNGYNECFYIDSGTEIFDNEMVFSGISETSTPAQITKAFIKGNNKKNISRTLLNRFSSIISKNHNR